MLIGLKNVIIFRKAYQFAIRWGKKKQPHITWV